MSFDMSGATGPESVTAISVLGTMGFLDERGDQCVRIASHSVYGSFLLKRTSSSSGFGPVTAMHSNDLSAIWSRMSFVEPQDPPENGNVVSLPILGGLHHHYSRKAA